MRELRATIYDQLRMLTPPHLRRWIKSRSWFNSTCRMFFGNLAYSPSYYRDVERIEASSVAEMARWIATALSPTTAIDVGCGPGHLMAALEEHGIDTFGVDISDAALAAVRSKGLRAEKFDLTTPGSRLPRTPRDIAISCEVAEHLPATVARRFVDKFVGAAPTVYFTAAEARSSHDPGLYHLNERPNDYWIALFAEHNIYLDAGATESARRALSQSSVISYLQKPLIFRQSMPDV